MRKFKISRKTFERHSKSREKKRRISVDEKMFTQHLFDAK